MADYPEKPGYQFPGNPPKEALDYFRAKDLRVGFSYLDVWGEEHAAAFTVAKAMQLDLLDDIRQATDKALAEGTTYHQFVKDLQPKLEARGWWGKQKVIDPLTGEKKLAQLGSPRRLKTIYDANLRSARSAAAWKRAQRTKKTRPYALYGVSIAERKRKEHRRWAGTLLPLDDPWWRTHWPPSAYGCKCPIPRTIDHREYDRLVRDGVPDMSAPQIMKNGLPTGHRVRRMMPVRTTAPKEDLVRWVNKRTGEEQMVDRGLDPAWANNPGMDRQKVLRDRLTQKADTADQLYAHQAVVNVVRSPILSAWRKKPEGELPIGTIEPAMQAALAVSTQIVRLSPETHQKQDQRHPELTEAQYHYLPDILRHGAIIQQTKNKLVAFGQAVGRWYKAVLKRTADGKLYLVSYHRADEREIKRESRRGKVLRALPQPSGRRGDE